MVTVFTITIAFLSGVCVGLLPAMIEEADDDLDNYINFD